jgi:hypothetical protein
MMISRFSTRHLCRFLSTAPPPTPKECFLSYASGPDTGIATVTLDRPARKNAIGTHLLAQFSTCIATVRADASIRVLLVRSNVDRVRTYMRARVDL